MTAKTITDLLSEFGTHEDSGLEVRILRVMHTPSGGRYGLSMVGSFSDKEEAEAHITAHPEEFDGGTADHPVTYHVIEIETGSYKRMREL